MNPKFLVLFALVSVLRSVTHPVPSFSSTDSVLMRNSSSSSHHLQVGVALSAESPRQARQAGVPEGFVLTSRLYQKGNNGKYIPDNSGKYIQRNVKYVHHAGQKSATVVNIGGGGGAGGRVVSGTLADQSGKYVPDNSGRYTPGGSGKYVHSNAGQYKRSNSEGKYRPETSTRMIQPSSHSHHATTRHPSPPAQPRRMTIIAQAPRLTHPINAEGHFALLHF